jgi:hypothetical protein
MPLQNRVLPTGEIIADPARGLFTGNRGILQFDTEGRLGPRRWTHPHWIICALTHPRGRYHGPQPARGWTPLFFLDEAVALAAGHRPCAYCRPAAYAAWKAAWAAVHGAAGHRAMDRALHAARVTRQRRQVRHEAPARDLPTGAVALLDGQAHLATADGFCPVSPAGYGPPVPRPAARVSVLTPAPAVAVLRAGYRPALHASAVDTPH